MSTAAASSTNRRSTLADTVELLSSMRFAITLLVIPFMQGGYYVQDNLNKMLIQGRKTWSLLLIFLIVSLLIILVNGGNHYVNWYCCLIPLAVFHAAAYFYPTRTLVASLMHWIIFLFALTVNYFPQWIP